MRWTIADLFILVALVAVGFAYYRFSWSPMPSWTLTWLQARVVLVINVAMLSAFSLAAWYTKSRWRLFCLAYACVGWVWLGLVLFGRFDLAATLSGENRLLAYYTLLGILLALNLWAARLPDHSR